MTVPAVGWTAAVYQNMASFAMPSWPGGTSIGFSAKAGAPMARVRHDDSGCGVTTVSPESVRFMLP